MNPPRSAFGASPPGGRHQRTGRAGSAVAAWLLLLVAGPLHAQVADPTRPPMLAVASPASATAPARAASAVAPRPLRVLSVQLPQQGPASALVDQRLVFVGDKLGDATVVAIDAQGVELRRGPGRSERLHLIDRAIVKQASVSAAPASPSPAPVALGPGGKQP